MFCLVRKISIGDDLDRVAGLKCSDRRRCKVTCLRKVQGANGMGRRHRCYGRCSERWGHSNIKYFLRRYFIFNQTD